MSELEKQIGGDHYKSLKIQPVEYIMANGIPYVEGNIIKYITRWRQKGGIQDIEKVIHYANILLEAERSKQLTPMKTTAVLPFKWEEGHNGKHM